jgi:hypothetical protein
MTKIFKTFVAGSVLALVALTAGLTAGRLPAADAAVNHAQALMTAGHHMTVADADIGDGTSPSRKG